MDRRKTLWTLWAVIPVLVAIWWFGPGQDLQARTRLSSIVEEARLSSEAEDWKKAVELYQQALADVPDDDMEAILWLRLQTSHADFMSGNTWAGITAMEEVMNEAATEQPDLADDARARMSKHTGIWVHARTSVLKLQPLHAHTVRRGARCKGKPTARMDCWRGADNSSSSSS